MEEMDNAVHSNRLTRMVEEVSNILLEMNSKDINQLKGQAWLDEQMLGDTSKVTESVEESTEELTEEPVAPRNRLHLGNEEETLEETEVETEVVSSDSESETESVEDVGEVENTTEPKVPKVIVTKLKPIEKTGYKNIELVSIKPQKKEPDNKVDETIVNDELESTVQSNAGLEILDDKNPAELTRNQQNIKNVFEQVMESATANQEKTAVDFINYCIMQTRNTFGLKTTLQTFDFYYDTQDVMTSRAQEGLSEVELAKYYLQYLLEEVDFLRYLEPKEELLIPKIEANVTKRDFSMKEIPIVESVLEVKSTFARNRDYNLMARVLKISMDMKNGSDVVNALNQNVKGGIVLTIDSKTKLPRTIENELRNAKLSFAKLSGKEIQEQIVTVDSLKFDEPKVGEGQVPEVFEKPLTNEASEAKDGEDNTTGGVSDFWEKWQTSSETDKEIEVAETPAVEQVVIEQVEAPVEVKEVVDEPEVEVEEDAGVELNEEECRSLLKFLATAIDTDYKPYLRMTREDQEADLILDLQTYLSEIGNQVKYKQEYKYSKRLKEVYRPLYEIVTANGYDIESLRSVEDFTKFVLEYDEFKNKETIYLYQILLAIKDFWKEQLILLEQEAQEEQERLEIERKAQEEQERLDAEQEAQEEIERQAQEEAERKAQEEQEELEKAMNDLDTSLEGNPNADVPLSGSEGESEPEPEPEPKSGESQAEDWLLNFESEEPDTEFNLESEISQANGKKSKKEKKSKKSKKKKAEGKAEPFDINLSDGEVINDDKASSSNKKVITGIAVATVAVVGLGGFGLVTLNNHLNGNHNTTAQTSKPAENKINILKGALDEKTQVTFIDKNNSNKLSPNPYDKLLLAHADKASDDQLKKLGLTQKTTLTITDSGEQVSITISGVVSSKEAKVTDISQLKDVDYLKWVDSNNVPYFMPFKV